MISLSFLIAASFTLVSPQLALAQHTALMELYDALGLAIVEDRTARAKKNNFFSSGCPPGVCPRFAATAPCSGGPLTCVGSNATALYGWWVWLCCSDVFFAGSWATVD